MLGAFAALLVVALLEQGRAEPPPPYVVYDVWWGDGLTAASCYYYDGAFKANEGNFYVNCSIIASGPDEANPGMNQPKAYSTGSPKLLYTKCTKSSAGCATKDLCWTGWESTFPRNKTVQPKGCLKDLHLDYFSVLWEEMGTGLWRGALPGTGKHNICYVNNIIFSQQRPTPTCIEAHADETDLKNAVLSTDTSFYPIVAYTEFSKHTGKHHLCYFNATGHGVAPTPTCDYNHGWSDSESPRTVENNYRFPNFLTVRALEGKNRGFCTIAANFTGGWSCLKTQEDLGDMEDFYIEDVFMRDQHHHKAAWFVPSREATGVTRGCTALYRGGRWEAPQCLPYLGSLTPRGKTVAYVVSAFSPSRAATFAVELSDGRNAYCSNIYSTDFCHTLPKGLTVTSLSTSLGFVFQALNGTEVNVCRFDFFQPGKHKLTCMQVGKLGGRPINKISPFTDWFN